jgi:hypothetical protein
MSTFAQMAKILPIWHTLFANLRSDSFRLVSQTKVFSSQPIWLSSIMRGCQRVYFHTKNTNFGLFQKALECTILVYFKAVCYLFWSCGVFYSHLV